MFVCFCFCLFNLFVSVVMARSSASADEMRLSKTEEAGMKAIIKGQESLHRGIRANIQKCLSHEWCLIGLAQNEGGENV